MQAVITWKPIGDALGTYMPWDQFQQYCLTGLFVDYDGWGFYATESECSDVEVCPSDVVTTDFVKPSWATHVVWSNR
jgi:hypothetical protein